MELTLAGHLGKAYQGQIKLFSGTYTPEDKIPLKGYRVTILDQLQPAVAVYCDIATEHLRQHQLMEAAGTTERSARHGVLHEWCKILGSMIVVDLSQFRPKGAGMYGFVISPTEFFWYPAVPNDPSKHPTLLDVLLGKILGNSIDVRY